MKIAMIGPKRIPSREGGIDVVVGELSSRLSKLGHEVTIYVRRKKSRIKDKYYNGCELKEVFTINKKTTDALISSFFATIQGILGNYDVLHFHASGNTLFLFLTRFSKKKIVVTVHGIDWKRSKFKGVGTKVLIKSEQFIAKYADAIITLCENDSDYFKETYNRDTIIIPNGFERYSLVEPQIIGKEYGLYKDEYILFLARIVPEKGLHYLIEAYNQIDIPQKLVIAGGSSHSTDYYNEMQERAKNNSKIVFTGFVQGQVLEELFSNAYIYVLPSDIEGMPMSLLEALGHERICLVSDIRENKVDPINSYYFEHGSVESLKSQLLAISKNRKSYQFNGDLLDWDGVVKKTIKVYEECGKCQRD